MSGQEPARSALEIGLSGLSVDDVTTDTAVVGAELHVTGTPTTPLVPPITHSSTYALNKVDDFMTAIEDGGTVYSRLSNLTQLSVECAINAVEKGAGSLVFSSGMAALSSIYLAFLTPGDHVIAQDPLYSGNLDLLKYMSSRFGIEISWVRAGCSVEEYRKNVKPNTKVLIGETPCNPEMSILDLKAFGELGQSLDNVLTMVDGTFASPYLQQAVKYGIDFSMHSCTKYMGGHSDLLGGCVTARTVELWRELKKAQGRFGACLSPHDCSLLLRGMRTLPVRMKKHGENAQRVAEFLDKHPKVLKVKYPGLPTDPGHEIAKKQMSNFGGMLMIDVAGGMEGGKTFVESLRIGKLAVSLGGVETTVEHVASMTHGPYLMSQEEREHSGITPGMVRISVGIEDAEDLVKDFAQALEKISL